jgi:hypothetical protein
MTTTSVTDLRSLLLARSTELTGKPAERLVDDEGDVQLADSPFGIWARLMARAGDGRPLLVFVLCPLMELAPSGELEPLVKRSLAGRSVEYRLGSGAIQLFAPVPVTVLDRAEDFRSAFESMLAVGNDVVAAVQPKLGGLTPEQHRVLGGWRGRDDGIEDILRSVAADTGATMLSHGWDPRRESPPLLCFEDRVEGGWANRFVTLDAEGAVRFRSTVPGVRDGARGFALTIHRLDPEAARAWAERLGTERMPGKLSADAIRSLAGRAWKNLWDAMDGLPRDSGDAWQPAGE